MGCEITSWSTDTSAAPRLMNESMELKGKVALTTGGGKGMCRAIGLASATERADVAVNDVDYSDARKVAAEVQSLGR